MAYLHTGKPSPHSPSYNPPPQPSYSTNPQYGQHAAPPPPPSYSPQPQYSQYGAPPPQASYSPQPQYGQNGAPPLPPRSPQPQYSQFATPPPQPSYSAPQQSPYALSSQPSYNTQQPSPHALSPQPSYNTPQQSPHALSPQTSYNTSQQGPYTLIFQKGSQKNTTAIMDASRQSSIFTVSYDKHSLSSSMGLTLFRGSETTGPSVGTAVYHAWTTKIDIQVSGRAEFKYKDHFQSQTDLGEVEWNYVGKKRTGNLQLSPRKGGSPIAAFYINRVKEGKKIGSKEFKQDEIGRAEFYRQDLTPAQFDEVVLTLVAEVEAMRKNFQGQDVASAINMAGSVGGAGA